jgi:hypothetical protein
MNNAQLVAFADRLNAIIEGKVRDDAGDLVVPQQLHTDDKYREPCVLDLNNGLIPVEVRDSHDDPWQTRTLTAVGHPSASYRFSTQDAFEGVSMLGHWKQARITRSPANHIADANKKVDPLPSEEKPKNRTVFQVGDPVVTSNGRRGSIEAIGLIDGFPITVRHSKREAVSYRPRDVSLDTDPKSVVKEPLTAEPKPTPKKYRKPTILDLSNGPIRCEVFDDVDEVWKKRWLTFVSDRRTFPFVTVDPENKDKLGSWMRCRIKAAFDPVTDLSWTAARMVGKAIDQMIHKGETVKPPQPEPVIKDCLTARSNNPEIPDSSREAMRAAFEA